MANTPAIDTLIAQINHAFPDWNNAGGTQWLKNYLNSLTGKQQQAAIAAVQSTWSSGGFSSANDINVAAHHAVDTLGQKGTPSPQGLSGDAAGSAGGPLAALGAKIGQLVPKPEPAASDNTLDFLTQPYGTAQKPTGGGPMFGQQKPLDVSSIQNLLNTIKDSKLKDKVIGQLKDYASGLDRFTPLTDSDIPKLLSQVQGFISGDTGGKGVTKPAATTPASSTAYNPSAPFGTSPGLSPEEWTQVAFDMGLTVAQAQESYAQTAASYKLSFVPAAPSTSLIITGQPVPSDKNATDNTSGAMGMNSSTGVQQGFADTGLIPQLTYNNAAGSIVSTQKPGAIPASQQISPREWLATWAKGSGQGLAYFAVQVTSNDYQSQYGDTMPQALRQQIIDQVNNMSAAEQATLGATLVSSTPVPTEFAALEKTYATNSDPGSNVTQGSQEATVTSAFMSQTSGPGRMPTAAEMAQLQGATPAALTAYIDNLPMPGTGLTVGTYFSLYNANQSQWQEYFGHDPTPADLRSIAGMSPAQVTDYIDNSPSSAVPGQTIGRVEDFQNYWDTATKTLGIGADDVMLGKAMGGSGEASLPAPTVVTAAPGTPGPKGTQATP